MTDFDSVAIRLGGSTPPTVAQGTFTANFSKHFIRGKTSEKDVLK